MNALAKKLLMKPGKNWLLVNPPKNYPELLDPLPDGVTLHAKPEGVFEGILLFAKNSMELNHSLEVVGYLIKPDTVAWICYPKKSSGVESDLMMMGNWDILSRYDLEVVSAASIDTTWTAVRARIIGQAKKSKMANADIKQNDYSAYVDVENKRVTVPPDVAEALKAEPEANQLYHSLAYSHQKEYILWVISAKQDKTRAGRVVKMMEKLLDKKKNPGEK